MSGGAGNNNTTSTTYIALFRVNGQPVEFRTNRPNSVSDGDQVVVAGNPAGNHVFRAYACRNVSTGELSGSGVWGNVFAAIFIPVALLIITGIAATLIGRYALYAGLVLTVLLIGYFGRQAVLAHRALDLVQA